MLTQDTRQARDYFAQKLAFVTGPFELDGQIKRREADHHRRRAPAERLPAPATFRARSICRRASGTRSPGLSKDRTAVIYCYSQTCKLAAAAAVEFASAGIPVVEMEGGFEAWEKSGLPVEQ